MQVMLGQVPEAGLGIDLGRAETLVSQELLDLVEGHSCVQQQGGHARPEPVRCDALGKARALQTASQHPLH